MYDIRATFVIYHAGTIYPGGYLNLVNRITQSVDWLNANTQFKVHPTIINSSYLPVFSPIWGSWTVDPGAALWSEIPNSHLVFLLFDGTKSPVGESASYGLTWPSVDVGSIYGTGSRLMPVSNGDYAVGLNAAELPDKGFDSCTQTMIEHEIKNAIYYYLDGAGYDLMNTYHDENGYIECVVDGIDDRPVCYRKFWDQLTPEMYEYIQAQAPVPAGGTSVLPLLLIGLGVLLPRLRSKSARSV